MRVALALAGSIAALVAIAIWHESRNAIDPSARSVSWGSPASTASAAGAEEMVLVRAGRYAVGDEHRGDSPVRHVELDAFLIDRHEVTNRQFARFVRATGYVTSAEREGGAWVYRGGETDWKWVRGASWRQPLGPDSSIDHAMDHPVVVVTWHDAVAYADWAGKRLPTEAEWEVAARAGAPPAPAEANPSRDGSANVWQGSWPQKNDLADGFFYTAPVASFAPNAMGLHDMIGNVWEWTADWYEGKTMRVARGGSWFCSSNYCSAFRPGFRGKSPPASAFNNVGFRCARDAAQAVRVAENQ